MPIKNEEPECYYKCGEPLGDGYFVVIKHGKVVRAHKQCHLHECAPKSNIRIKVRPKRGGTNFDR